MSVVTLPKDHQNNHRLRTALRNIHDSLAEQTEAVKRFRTNMSRIRSTHQIIGRPTQQIQHENRHSSAKMPPYKRSDA